MALRAGPSENHWMRRKYLIAGAGLLCLCLAGYVAIAAGKPTQLPQQETAGAEPVISTPGAAPTPTPPTPTPTDNPLLAQPLPGALPLNPTPTSPAAMP